MNELKRVNEMFARKRGSLLSQFAQQGGVTFQHTVRCLIKGLIVHLGGLDFEQKVQHLGPLLRIKGLDLVDHVCRGHA